MINNNDDNNFCNVYLCMVQLIRMDRYIIARASKVCMILFEELAFFWRAEKLASYWMQLMPMWMCLP